MFEDMSKTNNEYEVQKIYEKALEKWFKVKINHPLSCDGYLECMLENEEGKSTKLMLITEYKYDKDFMSNHVKSKVLVQVLYYLKRFEDNGRDLPNVILVGDKDEVFVMHSNDIKSYLDWDIDWSIAPSNAADYNLTLVLDIKSNKDINPFVYEINEDFEFKVVYEDIKHLTFDVKNEIRITDNNMSKVFDYFCNNVLKDKSNLSANDIVHIFIDLMLSPIDAYLHPMKKNTLVLSNKKEISVYSSNYKSFFNHYTRESYTTKQKERFTEISDRLIEDIERRRKGEFYTPTIWANEAHKMISDNFGKDWKEEYVVWDCCWGTGNLTRDYKFRELYCSTLNEVDLNIGKKYNVPGTVYNREGAKFQYDFLNDDVDFFERLKLVKKINGVLKENDFKDSKLYTVAPKLIRSLLEGKKLMFLINPPYGTAGNKKVSSDKEGVEKSKNGISKNEVNTFMVNSGIGQCSKQLYTQFLWRIVSLQILFNNITISIFSPTQLLTSWDNYNFIKYMRENNLNFKSGFMFQASQFADVKDNWSIMFSLYSDTLNDSILDVKDLNDNKVDTISKHTLYMVSKEDKCGSWCFENIRNEPKHRNDCYLSSALVPHSHSKSNEVLVNSLGGFLCDSNNINCNNNGVALGSKMFSSAASKNIGKLNFMRCVSYFTARRLITGQYSTWINAKDEYMIPNTNHELYNKWQNDCIVYSLFNSASNQSSLRQVNYNNKKWDVKNEFFFMSVEDIQLLADKYCNDEISQDIKEYGEERYVYKLLKNVELSEDSKAVLDKAIELTKLSFRFREEFNEDYPQYHINTWDAGWYQIKAILNEYMPVELKNFNAMYKALGDRMRPLVYELGFLKN